MIRVAVESDVEAIAHVHVASWRETYPGIMPQEILDGLREEQLAGQWRRWFLPDRQLREALIVCEDGGEVVGFASAVTPLDGTEAELLTLYVLRRAQGLGYGHELMTDIAKRMENQGATSLILWMAVGNPTAGFYEYIGGRIIQTETKRFGRHTVDEAQFRWSDISVLTGDARR